MKKRAIRLVSGALIQQIPAVSRSSRQCDSEQYSGVNHYISGPTPYPMQTYLQEWLPQIAALDGSFAAENIGK